MITINLNKAKEITHEKRRAIRAEEFKPYDEIIAKQIPGSSAEDAENERKKIREKYTVIQEEINSCQDALSLKTVYDSF